VFELHADTGRCRMRSRKVARRWCGSLLSSGAAVVLLAGAVSAATTSTMPIYTTTSMRPRPKTTTTMPHMTTTTRPGMTSTTMPGTTTTTTAVPIPGSCSSISACETALMATLPSATAAKNGKERRVAHALARLAARAVRLLDHASTAKSTRQARLFEKANRKLERLRTLADKAEAKGSLTVPVGPIDAGVGALMSLDHP